MQGKIIKGIAGFYYVHVEGQGTYECRAKGIFRKDGVKPLVGDDVLVDVLDDAQMTGNIREILPRRNALLRPAVANVDQALVIFAIVKPQPNFNLLDRFLMRMERVCRPSFVLTSRISRPPGRRKRCGRPMGSAAAGFCSSVRWRMRAWRRSGRFCRGRPPPWQGQAAWASRH